MTYSYLSFTIEKVILDIELLFIGCSGLIILFSSVCYNSLPLHVRLVCGVFGVICVLMTLYKLNERAKYFVPYRDLIKCNMLKEFKHYRGMYK